MSSLPSITKPPLRLVFLKVISLEPFRVHYLTFKESCLSREEAEELGYLTYYGKVQNGRVFDVELKEILWLQNFLLINKVDHTCENRLQIWYISKETNEIYSLARWLFQNRNLRKQLMKQLNPSDIKTKNTLESIMKLHEKL